MGGWNISEGKGTCCQACQAEFNLQDPKGGRKELTAKRSPTPPCTLWLARATHTNLINEH